MALLAMNAHRLRTSLTMLGIIIGIAAVVSVVALGEGSRRKIMDDIAEIGTNTVEVFPGKDFGDEKAAQIHTLLPSDADALARESYVDSVTRKSAPPARCAIATSRSTVRSRAWASSSSACARSSWPRASSSTRPPWRAAPRRS